MSTFHIEQFGCRATQADGAAIERQLREQGCSVATDLSTAEFVVVNTCTVTAAADAQARDAIRKIHAANPEARIIVTGCYAQRDPEELAAFLVFPTSSAIPTNRKSRFSCADCRRPSGKRLGWRIRSAFLAPTGGTPISASAPILSGDIFPSLAMFSLLLFSAEKGITPAPHLKSRTAVILAALSV